MKLIINGEELEGLTIVYRGGQHMVRCDGERHYLVVFHNGHVEDDGRCWCTKKKA